MTKTTTPENGFLAVLQRKEIQDGTLTEASRLVGEAAKAAFATGKKATVTVTITIEPKLNALNFGAKLKSTLPAPAEPLCIFYCDQDGGLHRDDPRQKELELSVHRGGRDESDNETAAKAS